MAKISLRAIEKSDLAMIQRWRNSDQVMPYCRQYRPLSMRDMEKWWDGLSNDSEYNLTNDLFVIEGSYEPIGVGGLVRIDFRNRKAEVSFYVADASDNTPIIEALDAIIQYGFGTLDLRKVYFPVYSFNPRLNLYKEVMEEEAVLLKEYYWNGEDYDRHILVAYNE